MCSFLSALIPFFPFAPYRKKIATRYEFERWFCGFTDGEGNFQVWKDRTYIRMGFRIIVHIDDVATLHYIRENLGVGHVTTKGDRAIYIVSDQISLINVILPIFIQHGLLTAKLLDLLDFQKVMNIIIAAGTSRLSGSDLSEVKQIIAGMNSGRTNYSGAPEPSEVCIYWLIGFFEAEGTVGLKNNHPYVQVAQHARSQQVLVAIQNTLHKLLSNDLVFSLTLNSKTNVYTLSLTGIDVLYTHFLPHIISLPFVTRKQIDISLWAIVIHLYYTGIAYTTQGRALIRHIGSYMNNGRYSTSSTQLEEPSLEMIINVLMTTPPVIRTPGISQVEYSKQIARVIEVTIYIYDRNKLHSIHNSYASAQEALGIKRTARTVSRLLDSGRLYNNRYEFTSHPK